MSQLYVGNLNSEATERHVQDVFSQYGAVKEVILKSGFAFVEMEDSAGARISKNELNGKNVMGSVIIVESSRQQRLSSQRPKQLRVNLGKVILSNIPDSLNWPKLETIVSNLGKVISSDILECSETGLVRSAVFYFETIEDAQTVANCFKDNSMCVSLGSESPQNLMSTFCTQSLSRPNQTLSAPTSPTKLNSNSEYPLRILVPSDMVGAIIGKDGNTIRNITQMTKARVDVHRRENIRGLEKAITIIGTPDACTEAAYQIGLIIQKEIIASSNLDAIMFGESDALPTIPLKILAHNELVGRVIGKNGQTLKKIMAETETKIIISKIKDLNDTNPERTITVLGSLENCKHAEAMISQKLRASYESDMAQFIPQSHGTPDGLNLLNQRYISYSLQNGSSGSDPYSSSTPSSPIQDQSFGFDTAQYETMIAVPKDALPAISGKDDRNLHLISSLSSAIIKIIGSETDIEENFVSIIGNMDAQATAQRSIFTKVAHEGYGNGNDTVLTVEMFVPALLISKLTTQIQQLQNHTGALIEIPRDISDQRSVIPLRILGNYQSSQAAQKKICSMLMHVAKILESTSYIQQHQTQQQTGSYISSPYLSPTSTYEVHSKKDLHSYAHTSPATLTHSMSYDYSNLSRLNSSSSEYSPISTSTHSSTSRRSSLSFDFQSSCSTPELPTNQILFDCLSPERYLSPVHVQTSTTHLNQAALFQDSIKLNSGFHQISPIACSDAEPNNIGSNSQPSETGMNRIRSTPQLPSIQTNVGCFSFGASSPYNQRSSLSNNETSECISPSWNNCTNQEKSSPVSITFSREVVTSESVLTPEDDKVRFLNNFLSFDENEVFQETGLLSREIENIELSKPYFPDNHLDAELISNLTRLTACESPELVTA